MSRPSKLPKSTIIKIKDDGKHYSCNKFFSYDLFYGMIDATRGIGKTTTFLRKAIINAKKGEEFIYIRRYKPELKRFMNEDSFSPIVDGVRYVGDGTGGYKVYVEDYKVGSLIALVTARSYKSVDFSKVTLIIFDEAFVHQTPSYRYLEDEVTLLLEFIGTVQRTRTNLKVVLLANNEDMFSPYHSYFNIPVFDKLYIDADRGIYCEHASHSEELMKDEEKTGLYHLIKGTAYGDYYYKNKVLGSTQNAIIDKPKDAKLLFRIIIEGRTLNMYTYYDNNKDVWLYCEVRQKVIKDNIAYEIMQDGKTNYLDVQMFKKRLKNYLYRFHFNKRISYNDETGGAIITWVIENV